MAEVPPPVLKYKIASSDLRTASAMLLAEDPLYAVMARRFVRRRFWNGLFQGAVLFLCILGIRTIAVFLVITFPGQWSPYLLPRLNLSPTLLFAAVVGALRVLYGIGGSGSWFGAKVTAEPLRRGALAAVERDCYEYAGDCELRIDEQGVVFTTCDQTVSTPWTSVMKRLTGDDLTVLVVFTRSGFTVPHSAFPDAGARQHFHDFVDRMILERGTSEARHVVRLIERMGLRCPECSYDLKSLEKNICPECGLELTLAMINTPARMKWVRQIGL